MTKVKIWRKNQLQVRRNDDIYTCLYLEWPTEKRSWSLGKFSEANMNKWMTNLDMLFILLTDTKARKAKQNDKI